MRRLLCVWFRLVRLRLTAADRVAASSSLPDFPRKCAGSPFGDRFLVSGGLILKACALLSSLRYAKRPSGLRVARLDGPCAATLVNGRAIACAPRLAALRLSLTTHLTRKARQAAGVYLARPEGFEPPTTAFGGQYSIQLSYGRMVFKNTVFGLAWVLAIGQSRRCFSVRDFQDSG